MSDFLLFMLGVVTVAAGIWENRSARRVELLLCIMLLAACTDEPSARQALDNAGFTEVRLTGWKPLSCGEDDFSSTGFVATNAKGKRVHGVVCCGMVLKSCTVRF